jgi:DNA-binding protein HU-beta
MNIAQLAQDVSKSQKMARPRVRKILDAAFAAIAAKVAAGEEVVIPKFGHFKVTEVAASEKQDPETGEIKVRPARKRTVFAPAKRIREQLRGGAPAAEASETSAEHEHDEHGTPDDDMEE